jgi:DNA-binding XRE family transcriptional regulator
VDRLAFCAMSWGTKARDTASYWHTSRDDDSTSAEDTGLSQSELAKKARVSQPYLSQLEAGTYKNPSIAVLQRLAWALKVPVMDLLQ